MKTVLLIIAVIQNFISSLHGITSVIWDKKLNTFVPLFSIPSFSAMEREVRARSRALETHNFKGESLKIAYYQEKNIFMFEENDTKVSGTCGEVWNILADYLNFTLIAVRSQDRGFGVRFENNSYTGLLGIIQRKEAQVVPRTGIFVSRLNLMEYTVPLWTTRYRLFIRPEWTHDEKWVFHIFSQDIWISILAIFITLSITGYGLQTMSKSLFSNKLKLNLQDHFFYTLALMCSQGSIPDNVYTRFKILSLCKSFFSWMIFIALSAHSISRMMNRTLIPPFNDLESVIKNTDYEIKAFEGSMVRDEFQQQMNYINQYTKKNKRISLEPSSDILYKSVCSSKLKYAVFDAEDRQKAIGTDYCLLIPTGIPYYDTWIASAVVRGFKYKRTIDIGLMRLNEFGLTGRLKNRWLNIKVINKSDKHFESIDMDQVYFIFLILLVGIFTSSLIAITEYMVHKTILKSKIKSRKNLKLPR